MDHERIGLYQNFPAAQFINKETKEKQNHARATALPSLPSVPRQTYKDKGQGCAIDCYRDIVKQGQDINHLYLPQNKNLKTVAAVL